MLTQLYVVQCVPEGGGVEDFRSLHQKNHVANVFVCLELGGRECISILFVFTGLFFSYSCHADGYVSPHSDIDLSILFLCPSGVKANPAHSYPAMPTTLYYEIGEVVTSQNNLSRAKSRFRHSMDFVIMGACPSVML